MLDSGMGFGNMFTVGTLSVFFFKENGSMAQGTIKKIVSEKGFGFITPSTGGNDIFFHMSAVEGTQFDNLHEGQSVVFEIEEGSGGRGKGPRASNVRVG